MGHGDLPVMAKKVIPPGKLEQFEEGHPFFEQVTAARLNAMIAAIEARTPRPGVNTLLFADAAGFSYSGNQGGTSGGTLGFTLSAAAGGVTVSPSVVTGFDTVYMPETDEGDRLDDTVAPIITFSGEETIYLKFEMEPLGVLIPGITPDTYLLDEADNDLVDSKILVVAEKEEDEQLAAINSTTGVSTATGVYYIPLGKATNTGGNVTGVINYMHGPIACRLCYTGIVSISPPVIVHTGAVDEIA